MGRQDDTAYGCRRNQFCGRHGQVWAALGCQRQGFHGDVRRSLLERSLFVQFLYDHGATVNAKNKRAQTPWPIAQGEYQSGSFMIHNPILRQYANGS